MKKVFLITLLSCISLLLFFIYSIREDVDINSYKSNFWYLPLENKYGIFTRIDDSIPIVYRYYISKTSEKEEYHDAKIQILFYESVEAAHNAIREYMNNAASWSIYPSIRNGIEVGDLSLGSETHLTFIRGNLYIRIEGFDDTSIVSLAKEIDEQILQIIYPGSNYESPSQEIFKDVNLKQLNEETMEMNIEMVLAQLQKYPQNCFYLPVKETFQDFTFKEERKPITINGNYRMKGSKNDKEIGYDIWLSVWPYDTPEEAKEKLDEIREFFYGQFKEPSTRKGRGIGDIAAEDKKEMTFVFVRGNVFVSIQGYDDGIPLDDFARHVDEHILSVITAQSKSPLSVAQEHIAEKVEYKAVEKSAGDNVSEKNRNINVVVQNPKMNEVTFEISEKLVGKYSVQDDSEMYFEIRPDGSVEVSLNALSGYAKYDAKRLQLLSYYTNEKVTLSFNLIDGKHTFPGVGGLSIGFEGDADCNSFVSTVYWQEDKLMFVKENKR